MKVQASVSRTLASTIHGYTSSMGQHLGSLLLASTLAGGCSLLYNPSNIDTPVPDAPPPLDAYVPDLTKLSLEDVGPHVVYEGQGDGGSRKAVIAVTGSDFVAGMVDVNLVASGGETVMFEIEPGSVKVSPFGANVLAFVVRFPVDPARGEGTVKLDVVVTQGTVTQTLSDKLELHNLDELDASTPEITDAADLKARYSLVDLAAGLTFDPVAAPPAKPVPVIVRSVSSIVLGDVIANAAGPAAGPGGYAGGGDDGGGTGGGKAGTGGGGAGHVTMGAQGTGLGGGAGGAAIGSPLIVSYATNHGSAGGGGTAAGGGGGGTIELTAGGSVEVGALAARGGAGQPNTTLLATGGGGGAGGVIVIRAGTQATLAATVDTSGAAGGAGNSGSGGAGRDGRVRIDAHAVTDTPAMRIGTTVHRGAAFDPALPLTTNNDRHQIFVSATLGDVFDVFVFNAGGASVGTSSLDFSASNVAAINPTLAEGYNRVCVVPPGTTPDQHPESTSCIEIVYLR